MNGLPVRHTVAASESGMREYLNRQGALGRPSVQESVGSWAAATEVMQRTHLLGGDAAEAEHANLLGDMIPGHGAVKILQVLAQQRTHANDTLCHPLYLLIPPAMKRTNRLEKPCVTKLMPLRDLPGAYLQMLEWELPCEELADFPRLLRGR